MCSSEGYLQHCKAGYFKLEDRDGPCGVFVTVKCGNGKHCSGDKGGTATSVRSYVVLKFPALKLSLKGSLASLFAECDPFLGKYQFL